MPYRNFTNTYWGLQLNSSLTTLRSSIFSTSWCWADKSIIGCCSFRNLTSKFWLNRGIIMLDPIIYRGSRLRKLLRASMMNSPMHNSFGLKLCLIDWPKSWNLSWLARLAQGILWHNMVNWWPIESIISFFLDNCISWCRWNPTSVCNRTRMELHPIWSTWRYCRR